VFLALPLRIFGCGNLRKKALEQANFTEKILQPPLGLVCGHSSIHRTHTQRERPTANRIAFDHEGDQVIADQAAPIRLA
jgi:hypothetical protein